MEMQTNIVSDVGTLLRIPTKVTTELTDKACLCIGSIISEAKQRGDTCITVNIGIGSLSINLVDMQSKFVPGKNLKTAIKSALASTKDPLELKLEQVFIDKLLSVCEEVF